MPCTIAIQDLVGIDTTGDGERDQLVVVGTVEDCTSVTVALLPAPSVPPGATAADGVPVAATVLPAGTAAFGVAPTGTQQVFTARYTLADTTAIKGPCGSTLTLAVLAQCDADARRCRDTVDWDKPVRCEPDQPVNDCPIITVSAAVDPDCDDADDLRDVTLTVTTIPFTPGPADVVFGHVDPTTGNPAIATVELDSLAGGALGQGSVVHPYPTPASGTAQYQVQVQVGRCAAEPFEVTVEACPRKPDPPPQPCPERVRLVVDGDEVLTDRIEEDGDCLPAGQHTLEARFDPPTNLPATFEWSVDGGLAVVGQDGVVAVDGPVLTLDFSDTFRSITVRVIDCPGRTDGIDLRPCRDEVVCCPELDEALTVSCLSRCPRSTLATLTATGTDLECAEVFRWDFGDGASAETTTPTTTHAYPRLDAFEAAVTIVRPATCPGDRTQRATGDVEPCPPSLTCAFLAVAFGLLLLAFLILMPIIACTQDPGTRQILIIVLIVVVVLLAVVGFWWFLDACCRPLPCELLRILFWVLSWALVAVGALAINTLCISAFPFGLLYVVGQQEILRRINELDCDPGAPDLSSWPFPPAR